jgi:hypothetical protein
MFRDVLAKYPLIANASSQHSDILYPQVILFVLSLCTLGIAFVRHRHLFLIIPVSNAADSFGS